MADCQAEVSCDRKTTHQAVYEGGWVWVEICSYHLVRDRDKITESRPI